ncbi:hypothetical protein G9A89_011427 [Geosiphon pyriformis]|nr:hypothetical protein G9A89_011427 [Geosiphon pyriformis]
MAYALIAKLDNFTGEEDDAQIWLNDVEKAIAANGWNDARTMQAIPYFLKDIANSCNNNSINCLVNTFTTMKQGETEAQLTMTISQHHRYLTSLSVVYAAASCNIDFESAELEANHAQAVNLVINGSSELDSKLEKFSESINKRLEGYLADNHAIYQFPQRHNNQGNYNHGQNQLHPFLSTNQQWQQETRICHYCATHLSTASISTSDLSAAVTSNILTTATNHLSTPTNSNTTPEPSSNDIRQPSIQSHSKLEISNGCSPTDSLFTRPTIKIMHPEFGYQLRPKPKFPTLFKSPESNQHVPTNTILLAIISSNEFLAAIFPFELEENTLILLFSGAALEEKPITAMYTDARVDGHPIKLILDSRSASSIITRQLMDQLGCRVDRAASTRIIIANEVTKTPIGEIDEFPFEVNGIVTPIKVLVMEATQYQALVGNDWLSKVNAIETIDRTGGGERKAYQVSWADEEHNKLPPIFSWDDNNKRKGKQKEELIWETDDLT